MGTPPLPVGEELRLAREGAGLELAEVASHLRIRSNFLSALEEGRPDALPGITYAIGYVRTYAGFLGLDPDSSVRRFKEEAAGLNAKTQLVFPSPAPEGRVPGFTLMLAALLLAGSAYGGWYWLSERDGNLRDLVPHVPERLARLIEGEAPPLPRAEKPSPATPVAAPALPGTAGSYADANPAGVTVSGARSTGGLSTGELTTTGGVEPSAAQSIVTETSAVAESSAPTATVPGAAEAIFPEATAARSAPPVVAEPVTAEQDLPSRSASETPDVTAPPEPVATVADAARPHTAAGGQTSGEQTTGEQTTTGTAAPEAATADNPDTLVPAAPRIAALIGASEAAVPTGRAAGGAGERIMIRATGDSWVQVRDANGTALFTRVLREGDIYRVPSQAGLKLATGNAGALEVLVDGTPAPSLGNFGEVVRNVTLDPALLASGTAATAR